MRVAVSMSGAFGFCKKSLLSFFYGPRDCEDEIGPALSDHDDDNPAPKRSEEMTVGVEQDLSAVLDDLTEMSQLSGPACSDCDELDASTLIPCVLADAPLARKSLNATAFSEKRSA